MIFVCFHCRDFQPDETVPKDDLGNPFCFGCGREMLPYYTASESTAPTLQDLEVMYQKFIKRQSGEVNDVRRADSASGDRAAAQHNKDK